MTTLAEILVMGSGGLPPVEQFDPKVHALLVPEETYQAAMQAQEQNIPSEWRHRMQPVRVNGETFWGIGADVLTEAIAPGIFAFIFQNLPPAMAATVQIIPYEEFRSMIKTEADPV